MSDLRIHATHALFDVLRSTTIPGEQFQLAFHFACMMLAAELAILVPCRARYAELQAIPYGFALKEWQTPRFAYSRRVVVQSFKSPFGILTSDAQPNFHQDIARSIGLYSIVATPILRQGQAHAVLCLQRRLTTAPFSPDDLDLLESIARITAQALD